MTIKRLIIIAIVLTLLFTPFLATAQELDIPDDREALEEAYRDMFDMVLKWKGLYEEERLDRIELQQERDKWKKLYKSAELDVERALKTANNFKELYYTEREMVMELLNKKNMSVSTGIGYNINNPEESLAMLQFEFGF